jgi:hypothetical protein
MADAPIIKGSPSGPVKRLDHRSSAEDQGRSCKGRKEHRLQQLVGGTFYSLASRDSQILQHLRAELLVRTIISSTHTFQTTERIELSHLLLYFVLFRVEAALTVP